MDRNLTDLFNAENRGEYVSSSALDAAKLKQLDESYSLKEGGAESIGRISLSYSKPDKNDPENAESKEKMFIELLFRLSEQRKWLLYRMEHLQNQIDELNDDIDEVSRDMCAVKDALTDLENDNLEIDENGYPIDERVANLIKEWEQQRGVEWNANDPNALIILEMMLAEQEQEIQRLENERNELQEQFNELNTQLQEIEASIEDVSNGADNFSSEYASNYLKILDTKDGANEDAKNHAELTIDNSQSKVKPMVIDLNRL